MAHYYKDYISSLQQLSRQKKMSSALGNQSIDKKISQVRSSAIKMIVKA